jgi:hypothetical protein
MKAQTGGTGIVLPTHNLDAGRRWVVKATPGSFIPIQQMIVYNSNLHTSTLKSTTRFGLSNSHHHKKGNVHPRRVHEGPEGA